jgi:TetR/AcrR family transcriptional regulator
MTVAERREREREARRHRILDAAERVFWDRGFEAAKMEEVAEAAQLGKGTLYLYFKTKDDLALAIAVRHQLGLIERFEEAKRTTPDGRTQLRELFTAYAARISTPLEHLALAMGRWVSGLPFDIESEEGQRARSNIERLFGMMCEAIARAQGEGTVRQDLPAPRLAVFMWSSVNGALLIRLKMRCFSERRLPMAEHALSLEEHIELLLDSLRPVDEVQLSDRSSGTKRHAS